MPIHVLNTVAPTEGKEERAKELLENLIGEMEKHEPNTIQAKLFWDADARVFYVFEVFSGEDARNHHHNQAYTANIRRLAQEEKLFASKTEVRMLDGVAGFLRENSDPT